MKQSLIGLYISCLLVLTSCLASKKVVYVEDMVPEISYEALDAPDLKIQKHDRLRIIVGASSPELAVPFNQGVGNYQVNESGNVETTGSSKEPSVAGYLVDANGEIDFPILGSIKLQGKTLDQAKSIIKEQLAERHLVGDALVSVDLMNLKINMLGEVASVGVIDVPEGRITLLEAISRSGGLGENAALDRILVIREEDGVRRMYVNNLEQMNIFDSQAFYLQQNDIVYVEPRTATPTVRENNTWRYIGAGIGLLGTIFALLNLIK